MRPEDEIARRYALLAANDAEGLLIRLEHQAGGRLTQKGQQNAGASKAERYAREGARAKAVQHLSEGIKQLSPTEQLLWAVKFLPISELAEGIYSALPEGQLAAEAPPDGSEVSQGEGNSELAGSKA